MRDDAMLASLPKDQRELIFIKCVCKLRTIRKSARYTIIIINLYSMVSLLCSLLLNNAVPMIDKF